MSKPQLERRGDWIQTFTGKQFWPLDPKPEDIDIVDIAHALSNQCRFAGHCKKFYSVAEHCVRVSWELPRKAKLWGLLHDASEAYLVDLPRPIKRGTRLGVEYKEMEEVLMDVICIKFGITSIEPPEVRKADNILLMTEARDLLGEPPSPWNETAKPLSIEIIPWDNSKAKIMYLKEFSELCQNHN